MDGIIYVIHLIRFNPFGNKERRILMARNEEEREKIIKKYKLNANQRYIFFDENPKFRPEYEDVYIIRGNQLIFYTSRRLTL